MLTEPHRRLCGHTAKITGVAWSPHHDARLVTVSYDGTAQVGGGPASGTIVSMGPPLLHVSLVVQVWDVLQEAPVSNYQGHTGYLLCVDWSPVDPDVIWTGGKDFTVQEWRVSEQESTKPPKGEEGPPQKHALAAANLSPPGKKKEKSKVNRKKKKTAGAAQLQTNGEAAPEEMSGEDEQDEVSSGNGAAPTGNRDRHVWQTGRTAGWRCRTHWWILIPAPVEPQTKVSSVARSRDKHGTPPTRFLTPAPAPFRSRVACSGSAPDPLKKKKPRSLLPVSTSMDHRPKEDMLQDCITLAAVTHGRGNYSLR